MRTGVVPGGVVYPVLFSLYGNGVSTPSSHVELAMYADDTVLVATFRSPALLISYMETYLSTFEHWLRDWRIVINV
jgi:hypothetical protein